MPACLPLAMARDHGPRVLHLLVDELHELHELAISGECGSRSRGLRRLLCSRPSVRCLASGLHSRFVLQPQGEPSWQLLLQLKLALAVPFCFSSCLPQPGCVFSASRLSFPPSFVHALVPALESNHVKHICMYNSKCVRAMPRTVTGQPAGCGTQTQRPWRSESNSAMRLDLKDQVGDTTIVCTPPARPNV